jgi:hypothetical protein
LVLTLLLCLNCQQWAVQFTYRPCAHIPNQPLLLLPLLLLLLCSTIALPPQP